MSEEKRFAVFILSHGRAKTLTTFDAMRRRGYTGDMFVVIDNEDDQEPIYRERFGEHIIQFDKRDYLCKTDLGDTEDDRRIGVFARNFIQDEAKARGYRYHLQLDDDIHGVSIRHVVDGKLKSTQCKNLDVVFEAMCDFLDSTNVTSLSFGLSPYYAGGIDNASWTKQFIHKCMTTFLMRADDVNYFNMRMNDDITTSALNGMRGKLYLTYMPTQLDVDGTQTQKGGMTEIYQENGTYRKSFYSLLAMPSCAKIGSMGVNDYRCHHQISWNHCTPKILNERWRATWQDRENS